MKMIVCPLCRGTGLRSPVMTATYTNRWLLSGSPNCRLCLGDKEIDKDDPAVRVALVVIEYVEPIKEDTAMILAAIIELTHRIGWPKQEKGHRE